MTTTTIDPAAAPPASAAAWRFNRWDSPWLNPKLLVGFAMVMSVVLLGTIGLWMTMGATRTFFPAGASWTLYTGGLFGFMIIASLTLVFPKIGAAYAIALMVGGQCLAALLIDHFGIMGMPREPLTMQRLLGVALVAAGVVTVRA